MTTTTTTKVSTYPRPLGVGDKVRFSIWMRPLQMINGVIIQVYAQGDIPRDWFYEVEYDFRGATLRSKLDHTDPTLYTG